MIIIIVLYSYCCHSITPIHHAPTIMGGAAYIHVTGTVCFKNIAKQSISLFYNLVCVYMYNKYIQFIRGNFLERLLNVYSLKVTGNKYSMTNNNNFIHYQLCIVVTTNLIVAMYCCSLSQLKERKLKDLEKDYPAYLEQQAELEDPVKRLEVTIS